MICDATFEIFRYFSKMLKLYSGLLIRDDDNLGFMDKVGGTALRGAVRGGQEARIDCRGWLRELSVPWWAQPRVWLRADCADQ